MAMLLSAFGSFTMRQRFFGCGLPSWQFAALAGPADRAGLVAAACPLDNRRQNRFEPCWAWNHPVQVVCCALLVQAVATAAAVAAEAPAAFLAPGPGGGACLGNPGAAALAWCCSIYAPNHAGGSPVVPPSSAALTRYTAHRRFLLSFELSKGLLPAACQSVSARAHRHRRGRSVRAARRSSKNLALRRRKRSTTSFG